MGEKGNVAEHVGAIVGDDQSLIERVTTTTRDTVVGASEDLATKVRDAGIGAVADHAVGQVGDRLGRKPDEASPEDPDAPTA